jgi:DNA-binding response OmpR family regulator
MNPSALPPKKVLVVDDEPAVLTLATRFLATAGYAATGATSALEGLRLLENEGWDLVILDRAMPEMNGEEMADRIKQRTPQMPIIMITGFPDAVAHRERLDVILRKPFVSTELLAHVARILEKK